MLRAPKEGDEREVLHEGERGVRENEWEKKINSAPTFLLVHFRKYECRDIWMDSSSTQHQSAMTLSGFGKHLKTMDKHKKKSKF